MGRFNVTITVMVLKKILTLNDYGPVTDPVTDPVTMLSRSGHGAYRASLHQFFQPMRIDAQIQKETYKSLDIVKLDGVGPGVCDMLRDCSVIV